MEPGTRARIEGYYLAHDPVRRAELAAAQARVAAEQAEHNAATAVDSADNAEQVASRTRQSVYKRAGRIKH
jgi:hypothetical protein